MLNCLGNGVYDDLENRRPSSHSGNILSSTSDLDSLVKRVQEAIGDEPPRSPELRRYINHRPLATPPMPDSPVRSSETFNYGELSVASQQYLHKYGLLAPSDSPVHGQSSHYLREPFKPVASSKLTFGAMKEEQRDPSPSRHPSQRARLYAELDENERILPRII